MVTFKRKTKTPNTQDRRKLNFKLGLALSGGGTRGLAHIGVLKAFSEERIGFDCVAGTSFGSLVGALYCAGVNIDDMVEAAKHITRKDIVSRLWVGSDAGNIAKAVKPFLENKTFKDLTVPFAAVAVDITDGQEVVLTDGNVSKAVSASCAVPALFKPVEMDGMLLVDGGLLNNMPADVCRAMGAEIVIGVDLNHNRGQGTKSKKIGNILLATWNIALKSTMYKGQLNSDLIIEPELSDFNRTSLKDVDEMVEEGYRAAKDKMSEIKHLLQIK